MIVQIKCGTCQKGFAQDVACLSKLGMGLPRTCPACHDEAQGRPEVVEQRQENWRGLVRLDASALHFLRWGHPFQGQEGDVPCWRVSHSGRQYGAEWNGRIVAYLYDNPAALTEGQIVDLADMEVQKAVHSLLHQRITMSGSAISFRRRVPPGTEGAEERVETDRYVRILVPGAMFSGDPIGTLVFAEAYSKTTLKGFGRQFSACLEGSPLWHREVYGAARSGRFHTTSWLAVVSPGDSISVHHEEDGRSEMTRYPAVAVEAGV